jgi:hypothetical protein
MDSFVVVKIKVFAQSVIRDLANTNLPIIMFSYYKKGGAVYEDIDFGSKWDIKRTCGLDFAFD